MTQDSESVVVRRAVVERLVTLADALASDVPVTPLARSYITDACESLAAAPSTSVREEELEATLRPFAEAADDLDDEHRDGSDIWEASVGMSITAGDLRRARAALVPSTDEGKRHG